MKQLIVHHQNLSFTLLIWLLCHSLGHAQVEYEQELSGQEYDIGFLLSWSTSDEPNHQVFIIERSINGLPFENIGSLPAQQTNGIASYEFKDLELGLKQVTYRLKEVAQDGGFAYSSQLTLIKQMAATFRVVRKEHINDELFQVTINTIQEGEIECRISDNSGTFILEELKTIKPGLNDYLFDFASDQDGTYTIIFKIKNELETVTFVKQTKNKKGNVANKKVNKGGG